jgi:spore coat protein U-like protein
MQNERVREMRKRLAMCMNFLGMIIFSVSVASAATETTSLPVSATVAASCEINSTDAFSNAGVLSSSLDGQASLSVFCTSGTAYSIAMDQGVYGTSVTDRKIRQNAGGGTFYYLSYQVFRDSARTLNWGSTSGVDTLSGTGTGSFATIPVYMRVPAQTVPATGIYIDSIVVTVTF